MDNKDILIDLSKLSDSDRIEMKKLGLLSDDNILVGAVYPSFHNERPLTPKYVVHTPQVINEVYNYQKSSSFSKTLLVEVETIAICKSN